MTPFREMTFDGLRIVEDKKLAGRKYGEMDNSKTPVIRVSPAVFKLLPSDAKAVIDSLTIRKPVRRSNDSAKKNHGQKPKKSGGNNHAR